MRMSFPLGEIDEKVLNLTGMVTLTLNSSTQEAEMGGSQRTSQPGPHCKFQSSQG